MIFIYDQQNIVNSKMQFEVFFSFLPCNTVYTYDSYRAISSLLSSLPFYAFLRFLSLLPYPVSKLRSARLIAILGQDHEQPSIAYWVAGRG